MSHNPPAFPQQCADALDVGMVHEGMTLRDWFAGQALAGMGDWSFCNREGYALHGMATIDQARAERAYGIADAMLAARSLARTSAQ